MINIKQKSINQNSKVLKINVETNRNSVEKFVERKIMKKNSKFQIELNASLSKPRERLYVKSKPEEVFNLGIVKVGNIQLDKCPIEFNYSRVTEETNQYKGIKPIVTAQDKYLDLVSLNRGFSINSIPSRGNLHVVEREEEKKKRARANKRYHGQPQNFVYDLQGNLIEELVEKQNKNMARFDSQEIETIVDLSETQSTPINKEIVEKKFNEIMREQIRAEAKNIELEELSEDIVEREINTMEVLNKEFETREDLSKTQSLPLKDKDEERLQKLETANKNLQELVKTLMNRIDKDRKLIDQIYDDQNILHMKIEKLETMIKVQRHSDIASKHDELPLDELQTPEEQQVEKPKEQRNTGAKPKLKQMVSLKEKATVKPEEKVETTVKSIEIEKAIVKPIKEEKVIVKPKEVKIDFSYQLPPRAKTVIGIDHLSKMKAAKFNADNIENISREAEKHKADVAASPLYMKEKSKSFADMTGEGLNKPDTIVSFAADLAKNFNRQVENKERYKDKPKGITPARWRFICEGKPEEKDEQIRSAYRGMWVHRAQYMIKCYNNKFGERKADLHPYLNYNTSRQIISNILTRDIGDIYANILKIQDIIVTYSDSKNNIENNWYIDTNSIMTLEKYEKLSK